MHDATTRIRREAMRMFARVGFGSTTIDDIAAAAEVGVATIYRRWDDKSALANDLYASTLDGMEQFLTLDLPSTPKRAFLTVWHALWAFAHEDPDRFVFLETQAPDAWISDENRARKAAIVAGTAAIFDATGVKADPVVANAILIGTTAMLAQLDHEADAADVGERVWQALRTPPPEAD